LKLKPSGVARCDKTCWNAKVMNLTFKLKLTCLHGKSERVLTHCTPGVPLKCQAGVERLVATGRRPKPHQHGLDPPTPWHHFEVIPHRLASGRGLVWCPDWFQGTSLGSCPDSFPDSFPDTYSRRCLGSCLDSSRTRFPRDPGKPPETRNSGVFQGPWE